MTRTPFTGPGGTFTLTYNGQTTAPIQFNNSGDFTTNAANIQAALAALSKVGAGNVSVTHDPVLNSSNQVTENRRFKIEFVNTLGHKDLMPITGSGAGLTGGSSMSVSLVEGPRAARHLDFNHSVFGALVVDGRLEARPWTDNNGQVRAGLELMASDVEFMSARQTGGSDDLEDAPF